MITIFAMSIATIKVYGLINSDTFHVARCCAEDLFEKFPEKFHAPAVTAMLECEWREFIEEKKIEIRGDTWAYADSVMCFIDDNVVGNHGELLQWAQDEFNYEDYRPEPWYSAVAKEAYRDYFLRSERKFAYLNITIDGDNAGRLLFELMSDVCPKTSENFRCLCTGEKGSLSSGIRLTYQGSLLHRVVPNGWIQGGDIFQSRGDCGECVFGGGVFEDENFAIPHSRRGILGMANKGRHTNGSQFYITLQPTPWMDCQFVAFGKLVEGTELLQQMEGLSTFNERPRADCKVVSCGEFIPDD